MKKTYLPIITTLCASMAMISCTSSLQLRSNPDGALVYIQKVNSEEKKMIGKAPLAIDPTTLIEGSGPYVLRIEMPGFDSKEYVLSELKGQQISFDVKLERKFALKDFNSLINQLFAAQSLAQQGQYEKSLTILSELSAAHQDVSAVWEMIGSVQILAKQYDMAVQNLEKAVKLDPENNELRGILAQAQKWSSRKPSGGP